LTIFGGKNRCFYNFKRELQGHKSFYVKNFLETISFVKGKSVDLIILGINAPGGKNREMIHNIKTHQPDVKILIFFLLMTIIAVANILLREQMDI
jgi:DNA-binding NarL/FixJ family response regulator